MSHDTFDSVKNKYTRLKLEEIKAHTKRIQGKTVLAVSKYSLDHVIRPGRLTRFLDRTKHFVKQAFRVSHWRDWKLRKD